MDRQSAMPSVDKGAGLRMTAPWDASCFAKPANSGLNRLVSKHRAYRAGTSPNWVNVKNPAHPAMARVKEAFAPKCYHNRKLLRGRAHSESSKLMDSAQRCRVSPDSPATTREARRQVRELRAIGFASRLAPACGEAVIR